MTQVWLQNHQQEQGHQTKKIKLPRPQVLWLQICRQTQGRATRRLGRTKHYFASRETLNWFVQKRAEHKDCTNRHLSQVSFATGHRTWRSFSSIQEQVCSSLQKSVQDQSRGFLEENQPIIISISINISISKFRPRTHHDVI